NLFRISFGAWLKYRHGIEILSGWKHETCGVILFVVYLVLIVSLDKWIEFLTSPLRQPKKAKVPVADTPEPSAAVVNTPPVLAPRWTAAAACLFAVLGVAGLDLGWSHYQFSKSQRAIPKSALKDGATFAMPDRVGAWVRLNSQNPALQKVETLGVFSQVWHY